VKFGTETDHEYTHKLHRGYLLKSTIISLTTVRILRSYKTICLGWNLYCGMSSSQNERIHDV
jgi:hypothetical protein